MQIQAKFFALLKLIITLLSAVPTLPLISSVGPLPNYTYDYQHQTSQHS